MERLLLIGVVGLLAQLVDGALGMAYGLTSSTLLLTIGVAPAAASASVHLAELGTTLASGAAHWRFGNVNWRTVRLMALPGGIGAFLGAIVLVSLPADLAAPLMAGFLFLLGIYVLVRFARAHAPARGAKKLPWFFLSPLGLFAGFMDAAGGGGWGPISTPTLMSSSRMEPRKVVGSVDTSEFLVALGASLGFLVGFSFAQVNLAWVGVLLAGGLIAAPMAAWIVKALPARILGTAVGGIILVTNANTLTEEFGLGSPTTELAYGMISIAWIVGIALAVVASRREGRVVTQET
jgi:uncharacterized membrane protein YfcA